MTPPAADAIVAYVREQVEATGETPSDRTIIIERFLDDVGDWRVVVMCPFGTRVHAPWAIAVAARLREAYVDVDLHYTDDGMAFRIPACETPPPPELFLPRADEVEAMVTRALDGTALFAARFRECAARALLLPRRDPRRRTPLWAQRKRASHLLAVASRHPEFPIVLEAYRECLRDAFDLPGLVALLREVEMKQVRVTTVDTRVPSPFAASVLFAFVASFIYDSDAPPAERRAQALTIDLERLKELLGDGELRSLLDADAIEQHVLSLQRLSRPATNVDAMHDMLLSIGDLSLAELHARCPPAQADGWARSLVEAGRAIAVRIAGEERIAATEDAARLRDALGVELPPGVPPALLQPSADPLRELVARYARTHGPFVVREVADRFGVETASIARAAASLLCDGRLVEGAFLPASLVQNGVQDGGRELCAREVLDALRRKSLAKLRRAIEPVPPEALARFLPEWQGATRRRHGPSALRAVIGELQGCPLVASVFESEILAARIDSYRPWDLDALCASGEVAWAGLEPVGANDGRIALYLADQEPLLARPSTPVEGATAASIRAVLARRGAVFFADLAREVGGFPNDLRAALWQMVWAGEVTNDTFEPLRALSPSSRAQSRRRSHPRRPREAATPPAREGRWSLRASRWATSPSETDRRMALARALLNRYGVVTREAAHAEAIAGGFAAVYDVLKAMEDQGRVRRAYFVEGRGGAQFSLPGADERLRGMRTPRDGAQALVLAATDPANAWGALLDWPASASGSPQRAAGALVVLLEGTLLGWLGRGDHALLTFLPSDEALRLEAANALARALAGLVEPVGGRSRAALLISSIDGVEAARSVLSASFARAGFVSTARGLFKRRPLALGGSADSTANMRT
jgi:ATP-dependent Lhr-like helicase